MQLSYTIKSYIKREGKLTKGQARALDELYPYYGIALESDQKIDFEQVFGNTNPIIVEIGFGNGDALITSALSVPDANHVGIEVYRPGIGALLIKVQQQNIGNIKIFHGDVVDFLEKYVQDSCLHEIRIFFPDPWHKKRHHKRRLIQANFVNLLCQKLKPKGIIHLATDWHDYAEQMLEVLGQNFQLTNMAGNQQYTARPESRPITKFEKRGSLLGHNVWDLLFIKDTFE